MRGRERKKEREKIEQDMRYSVKEMMLIKCSRILQIKSNILIVLKIIKLWEKDDEQERGWERI